MLHPHVPHELKDFGKHLFATFLGLLMALGLESCHQNHQVESRAKQALAAVRAELEYNRKDVRDAKKSVSEGKGVFLKLLPSIQAIRHKKTLPEEAENFSLKLNLADLPSSAWEAAMAAQVVHHLPLKQLQTLSTAYRVQQIMKDEQNALIKDAKRTMVGLHALAAYKDPKQIPAKDLDELIDSLRSSVVCLETLAGLQESSIKGYDAAVASIDGAKS